MNGHHCQNASVPQHIYGHVCSEILYGLDKEKVGQFEPCVIFGVTSIPSRALHFSILCESGAQWARIPINMLRHRKPEAGARLHPMENLQMWDAHGWCFSVTEYEYLREMGCKYRLKDGSMVDASYWFTLDHTDNGFSLYPPEHKCYHLLLLEDGSGQIAAMPNNRIVWKDFSFVKPREKFDYRVMHETTWHAEEGRRNPQETAHTQDPEVTSAPLCRSATCGIPCDCNKPEVTSATVEILPDMEWPVCIYCAGTDKCQCREKAEVTSRCVPKPKWAERTDDSEDIELFAGADVPCGEPPLKKALEELTAIQEIAAIKCYGDKNAIWFIPPSGNGRYISSFSERLQIALVPENLLREQFPKVELPLALEKTIEFPAAEQLHEWLKELACG